jgi:hypothetical protein
VRGRWAAGIVPRNFTWIIKDRLAISERPGGYAPNHRRVRRQEELLWLKAQQFDRVVSMLSSSHNLHAYDEFHLGWSHFPLSGGGDPEQVLSSLYPAMSGWLKAGERILIHQDELGDRLMGVIAGYLRWSGILPDRPRAITVVEQLLKRQMGSSGRTIVALVESLPGAAPPAAEDSTALDDSAALDDEAEDATGASSSAGGVDGEPSRPKRVGAAAFPAAGRKSRKADPASSGQGQGPDNEH